MNSMYSEYSNQITFFYLLWASQSHFFSYRMLLPTFLISEFYFKAISILLLVQYLLYYLKINMKIKTIIALVLLLTIVLSDQFNTNYTYDDFYRQFERTYEGEELRHHKQIFNKNFEKLKEQIAKGYNGTVTEFFDWNQTQIDAFLPPLPESTFDINSSLSQLSKTLKLLKQGYFTIPSSFDWRTLRKVTPVKNQGNNCGSGWAFAATAQYQSIFAIATNGTIHDLAQQYAFQCTYSNGGGCEGGSAFDGLKMIDQTGGIPQQSKYQYKARTNYYKKLKVPICSETNKVKVPMPLQEIINLRNLSVDQIQQQLVSNGPFSVGISITQMVSTDGYYQCLNPGRINHVVLLVGYTQTHWILKNSWGDSWGVNGYFYLPKDNLKNCRMSQLLTLIHLDYGFNPVPLPPNPNPPPLPPADSIVYNVSMTDSYGDGWEGTILGIRQNGVVVATFGNDFTQGFYKLNKITINKNIYAYIVVAQLGSNTKQIGFRIDQNNVQKFKRVNGTTFLSDKIFYKFCPSSLCEQPANVTYYLTLFDLYGDGWNRNTLAFNQNGVIQTFTLGPGKTISSPMPFTFKKYQEVIITVYFLGRETQECGYQLKTSDGSIVLRRIPPSRTIFATTILDKFTPQNQNYMPVNSAPTISIKSEEKQDMTPNDKRLEASQPGFKIATFILGPLLILTVGVALLEWFKICQYRKELSKLRNIERKEPQSAMAFSLDIQRDSLK